MNAHPFRRLGAALLLGSVVAGCSDAVGPDVTQSTDGTVYAPLPANPYSETARLALHGQMVALRGAEAALAAGADRAGAYAAASDRANAFLAGSGFPARVRLDPDGGAASPALRELTAAQQHFVDAVLAETEALSPEVSTEAFDARLAAIQAEAARKLSEADAQVVLLAVATASAFWQQYHDIAHATSGAFALLPTGDPVFAKKKPAKGTKSTTKSNARDFSWGGFGVAVVRGAVGGAIDGAVGGALTGSLGGLATGMTIGVLGGAVSGGADYLLDTLIW